MFGHHQSDESHLTKSNFHTADKLASGIEQITITSYDVIIDDYFSKSALEHLYMFYLRVSEPTSTSRVFNMEKEELARPSVTQLFHNALIVPDCL